MAKRYFGRLKQRSARPDPIITLEPEQAAEQRLEGEADVQPSVRIAWHAPALAHRDAAPLDVLAMILDGRSGRLWRALVDERKLALNAGAGYWALRYGGQMSLSASPRDPKQFPELEAAVAEIVRDVQSKPVSDRELQKVKNQTLANLVRELGTNDGIGDQLGSYDVTGDWRDVEGYLKRVFAVTADDVKRVAGAYLKPEGRNVLVLRRKAKK
jgi:predicted Zn-dependent peptidase